jgi:hypothetical protein
MNDIYVIGSVVSGILGLIAIVVFVSKKYSAADVIENVTEEIDKGIHIVDDIIEKLGIDSKLMNDAKFVLNVADLITEYIHDVIDLELLEDKKILSSIVINSLFAKFNVTPTEKQMNIIKIIIDESLEWLEKQAIK